MLLVIYVALFKGMLNKGPVFIESNRREKMHIEITIIKKSEL